MNERWKMISQYIQTAQFMHRWCQGDKEHVWMSWSRPDKKAMRRTKCLHKFSDANSLRRNHAWIRLNTGRHHHLQLEERLLLYKQERCTCAADEPRNRPWRYICTAAGGNFRESWRLPFCGRNLLQYIAESLLRVLNKGCRSIVFWCNTWKSSVTICWGGTQIVIYDIREKASNIPRRRAFSSTASMCPRPRSIRN